MEEDYPFVNHERSLTRQEQERLRFLFGDVGCWSTMSEDVRRLLSGLELARDVNRHGQVIDRWIAEGNYDRLREVLQ